MDDLQRRAVVLIRLETGHKEKNKSGTGFLVAPDLVLTAYHVVTPGADRRVEVVRRGDIWIDFDGHQRVAADLVEMEVEPDWALLRCRSAVPQGIEPLPLRDPRQLGPDETIWDTWGFPRDQQVGLLAGGTVAGLTGSPQQLQLSYKLAQTARALEPEGFSGSPVMVKGCAVGIMSSKLSNEDRKIIGDVVYATPIGFVLDKAGGLLPPPRTRFNSPGASRIDAKNGYRLDWIEQNYDTRPAFATTAGQGGLPLMVQTAADYGDLLRGVFDSQPLRAGDLLSSTVHPASPAGTSLDLRRILLHAPGGAGKTAFLCELARHAFRSDIHIFLLNLAKAASGKLSADSDFETIFNLCSEVGGYDDFRDAIESPLHVLLLADALNETERNLSEQILDQCDRRLADPWIQLVVADRMNPRPSARSFRRITLLPLERKQVRTVLGSFRAEPESDRSLDLLTNPFFLNLYLKLVESDGGQPAKALVRGAMIGDYFRLKIGLGPEETTRLAEAAFRAYEVCSGTEFEDAQWRSWLPQLAARLEAAGVVVHRSGEGRRAFRHQLLHDYLVGLHLAQEGETLLNHRGFDIATFRANSADSLLFCAERLSDGAPQQIDDFFVQLYDWNARITIDCLADLIATQEVSDSLRELGLALSALSALRLHDRVVAAARKAAETLERIRLPEARRFAKASSIEELQEAVRRISFRSRKWAAWKDLFLAPAGSPASEQQVSLLGWDPLTGWTAANILRFLKLSKDRASQVRVLYRAFIGETNGSRRWRVVHVLGAHPSKENVSLLMEAAERDPYEWVVYGAVRSLVEIASRRGASHRRRIVAWFDRRLSPNPQPDPMFMRALRWTAAVAETEPAWLNQAERLLRKCKPFTQPGDLPDLQRALNRIKSLRGQSEIDDASR